MLLSALIYALLLALLLHLFLRFLLSSPIKTRMLLFFMKRAALREKLILEIGRFADSPAVQDKMAAVLHNHLKNTFAGIKAKVPFASSFLSSDFIQKIELEAEEAILAVLPEVKHSIKGEMQRQFDDEALLKLLSLKEVSLKEKEIWKLTLAAFFAGLALGLAAEAIKASLL